jgi:hypothetical protein
VTGRGPRDRQGLIGPCHVSRGVTGGVVKVSREAVTRRVSSIFNQIRGLGLSRRASAA